jgi:hypothetical protein
MNFEIKNKTQFNNNELITSLTLKYTFNNPVEVEIMEADNIVKNIKNIGPQPNNASLGIELIIAKATTPDINI